MNTKNPIYDYNRMYENPLIGVNDEDSMDLDTKHDNNDEMEVENEPEKEVFL
jgi:hypothetical protein